MPSSEKIIEMKDAIILGFSQGSILRAKGAWKQDLLWTPSSPCRPPHSLGCSFQWGSLTAQNAPFWMGFAAHTDDQHPQSLTEAWLMDTRKQTRGAAHRPQRGRLGPTGPRPPGRHSLRSALASASRPGSGGSKPLPPPFVASLALWELLSWHRFSHPAEGQAGSKDECSFPSTLPPVLKLPIPPRLMPDALGVSGLP